MKTTEVQTEQAAMLALARGCLDYCGGHRGAALDAYHDGIWTVITVLERHVAGDADDQARATAGLGNDLQWLLREARDRVKALERRMRGV